MDPELWYAEFTRRLDELDARSRRRWAALEQRDATVGIRIDSLEQRGATEFVVADNWGGLFEPAPVPEERILHPPAIQPRIGVLKQSGATELVVADNWSGLFDEIPAPNIAYSDSSSPPPVSKELARDAVEEIEEFPLQIQDREEKLEVDEKVLPSIDSEVLKSVVSALDRDSLAHGAISPPIPPPQAPLPPPRLRQPRRARLRPLLLHQPRRASPCPPRLRRPWRVPLRRRERPPWILVRGRHPLHRARAESRTRRPQGARRDCLRRRLRLLRRRLPLRLPRRPPPRPPWLRPAPRSRNGPPSSASGRSLRSSSSISLRPRSGGALTGSCRGGAPLYVKHAVPAAAFLPKLHGGNCNSLRPRPRPDPPDATVRRAHSFACNKLRAAYDSFVSVPSPASATAMQGALVTISRAPVDTEWLGDSSRVHAQHHAAALALLPPPPRDATASPIPTLALGASSLDLAAAWSKSCAPSVHAVKPAPVPTTRCSIQVRNSFERRVSASTTVSTLGELDQMLKRYITDFTHAYSIGVVMFYSAPEIHGGQEEFGRLFSHCLEQFWLFLAQVAVEAPWSPFMLIEIKGNAVHLRPVPWQFFCGYAAPMYLETSLSVNIMLTDSTQLSFGLWSPFYLGWPSVQSSGSVVQTVVWPILMHEISAANMEHLLVSVQHKGELLNPDAVFLKLISGFPVVLNTRELCDQVSAPSEYKAQLYECCFVDIGWKLQRAVEVYLVHLIIDRRTGLLLDIWGLLILPAYICQGVFLVDSIHVLVATVGSLKIGLHWYTTRCNESQPWPPPMILHSNITSALVETISVGSKLNDLDSVTLAASDFYEMGYDDIHRYFVKKVVSPAIDSHDEETDRASGFMVSLCLAHTSTYKMVTTNINLVDWQLQKVMSDNQVWCHCGSLFSITVLQVPWDPGGSKLLHRLGGKPKIKKGGMSGTTHGWAFIMGHGLGPSRAVACRPSRAVACRTARRRLQEGKDSNEMAGNQSTCIARVVCVFESGPRRCPWLSCVWSWSSSRLPVIPAEFECVCEVISPPAGRNL